MNLGFCLKGINLKALNQIQSITGGDAISIHIHRHRKREILKEKKRGKLQRDDEEVAVMIIGTWHDLVTIKIIIGKDLLSAHA